MIFVELNIVSRGLYVPIFTNEPYPIRLMVPTWIRPYEALLTLEAVDAAEFRANVRYQLETGKTSMHQFGQFQLHTKYV